MIGILLIATRKYKQFVQPLLDNLAQYFLDGFPKTIFVFTDEGMKLNGHGSIVKQIIIPDYKWPLPTLYRYKIFRENYSELIQCSHLYYMDVDMSIMAPVREEILVDGLMAVRHPGFYVSDLWGSEGNPETSLSFFPVSKRKHYYAGGVQGGRSSVYLEASVILAQRIDDDEQRGVRAEWHDETHWNKYTNFDRPELVNEFTPSYCMVEQEYLRKSWGIDHLEPKIIALSKDHNSIRE